MSTITLDKVTKRFGKTQVIHEFSQEFGDREFVTLLGPSGCGKTTLLRMIAGFERPTSGSIRIGETTVSQGRTFLPPEKRGIGMVFQSYAVWPHMTVFNNVAYPLKIKRVPRAEIKEKVGQVLHAVHLDQYAERLPSQLSGGQQQRVALARALAAEPSLLLLDEPLSNLDAKLRESMRFEIKEIQRAYGITVVYVTHDQTEAMAMSDRIIVLSGGVIQQVGGPGEIYRKPANQFVADFVGKVNLLHGRVEGSGVKLDAFPAPIPYTGACTGQVVMAVRPENIRLTAGEGPLSGKLLDVCDLGESTDCRVQVGGEVARVTTTAQEADALAPGSPVSLEFVEYLVYPDTGEDVTRITT